MKYFGISSLLILLLIFTSGCNKDETDKIDLISGLWSLEKVTENEQELSLPEYQRSLNLLIESNGVYRSYAKDALVAKDHFGAWSITDNTWLEMTIDKWHFSANPTTLPPANQWVRNHLLTRFTILAISNDRLEIRIKTFEGEKKYSAMFVEEVRPVITDANYDEISRAFITLKTYVFTFHKVQ